MKLICPHCQHKFDGTPFDGSAQCPKCKEFFNIELFVVCKAIDGGHIQHGEFYSVHTTMDRAQHAVDRYTREFGPTFIITNAPLDV